MRKGYEGTGPGPITPDGCAVDMYARLPAGNEPDVIEAAVPPGASILELGSGAGRVTHPLIARGFAVTAVDESPDMLARISGARRTVHASIEELDLDERFDVVMLASFLVHTGDPAVRRGMLRTCRKHLKEGGRILIQREGADWHTNVPRERVDPSGYRVRIVSSEPVGDGVHSVHGEYAFADATWTQTFRSRPMTPAQLEECLAEADLETEAVLTDDGTWIKVRPLAS
ncbi:class I SAM-dependent methyltransferase [Streptomyces sp. NPDC020875]|uniref:class I SAM-dependent methyltransferase n=1 Tax=Streptomyces sp. NPDC020875 TaxID=3154898 RepID=UPI0033ED008A